jgi:hypothetical protein
VESGSSAPILKRRDDLARKVADVVGGFERPPGYRTRCDLTEYTGTIATAP